MRAQRGKAVGKTMYKPIWLSVALVFLCSACVSYPGQPQQIKIHRPLPKYTQSVALRLMPITPRSIKNLDGTVDVQLLIRRFLSEALALKEPNWQVKFWEDQTAKPKSDLLVNMEILEIDAGSRGARFWIGLNAGAAQSAVRVSILDSDGKEIASTQILEITACAIGWCTDSNEAMIVRNLENLSGQVTDFIANPSEYAKRRAEG